jgi:hypothetical protein
LIVDPDIGMQLVIFVEPLGIDGERECGARAVD